MNTKQNKFILTLLSMAAIGLSSAGLQAQDTDPAPDNQRINDPVPVQLRERLNQGLEKIQISNELQAMIDAFRENRQELLEAYRANRGEVRAKMLELREKYEGQELTEEEKAELIAQMKEFRDNHRSEVRVVRQQLREEMRAIREQIKLEREGAEG
jgi:uncharacterized coiled-coil DUF342 family protein